MAQLVAAVLRFFPPPAASAAGFVNKPALREAAASAGVPAGVEDKFRLTLPGAIKYVYATGIGPGAAVLGARRGEGGKRESKPPKKQTHHPRSKPRNTTGQP